MAPSTLSITSEDEIVDMVVNKGYGVKGLKDLGLENLPNKFIQPTQKRMSSMNVLAQESIPIIDMSKLDEDPKVMDSICEAAQNWGFFVLINHGIPTQVMDNVMNAAVKFFDLPPQEKMKYVKGSMPNNNVRFSTSFAPEFEEALEWKDYLSLFHASDEDEEVHALWPSVCRDEAWEYTTSCKHLAKKLFIALMKGLNIQEIDKEKSSLLMGSWRTHLVCYPTCPNPELAIGVGSHSDGSTLTILQQDQIGGLYVRKMKSDGWIYVTPLKGSLVVNVGDSLEIMSNGRYKSIEHCVVPPSNNTRYSVPVFTGPKSHDIIGPLPEVLNDGDKPLYKQVSYSDYLINYLSNAHNGKSSLDFARI